jgi:hypothetical protein
VRLRRAFGSAGTRITLYDVMDYFTAGYPAKPIREKPCLTDAFAATPPKPGQEAIRAKLQAGKDKLESKV